MSKPATKPVSVARKSRKPTTTPASSRSKARAAEVDDDDDDDDDDDIDADEELLLFTRRPPLHADHMVVVAVTHSGDAVVQDRSVVEAKRAPVQLAKATMVACERWARVDGRSVKFRATWMHGEKVIASHQWTCGEGKDPTALDGTVESFLAQQQRYAEAQQRMHLEGFSMVQESWRNLLQLANKRNEALERDNAELRDRLRKVDDVGSEIALESARSELEQRGRTVDLIEKRLLPIAQAFVVQKMQETSDASARAAPANERKQE